jgi:hypothetical protein
LRKAYRQLVEQIVRMLPIMERLVVPRFASLKQKRVSAPAFSQRIKTHRPYIGVESGSQLVPELSRLIGSASRVRPDSLVVRFAP